MSIMAEYLLLIFFMTDVFSLTNGQGLTPPTLTAYPSLITETDSVILNCQPPPSVSVSRCYFYKPNLQILDGSLCLQTVRGSDLLTRKQNFPAQVKLQCYYIVEGEQTIFTSKHSAITYVTVQSARPEMILYTEQVIICSLPPYVTDSKCNLYFGEFKQPYSTTNSKRSKKGLSCQFVVSEVAFMRYLNLIQKKVVSCDYSTGNGSSSFSIRSEPYNLSDFMRQYYPRLTTASSDSMKTTDLCYKTKVPHSEFSIWLLVTLSSACGLVMGSVLTILAFFCSKWIKDSRTKDTGEIQTEDGYDDVEATGPYMPLNKTSDVYATLQDQSTATPENINQSTV